MKIRDNRSPGWFWINNEFFKEEYAKELGIGASITYFLLCMHSDNNFQTCFPSIDLLSKDLGVSKMSIIRYIKKLEDFGIIVVEREKDEKTKRQKNNLYVLLNKDEWKPIINRVTKVDSEPGNNSSESRVTIATKSRVTPRYRNYTQINNKTSENNTQPVDNPINPITDFFKEFWLEYPIKVGKKPASRIWTKINPSPTLAQTIIEDVKKRKTNDRQWLAGYIHQPTTYLNQERWNDEIITSRPPPPVLETGTPYVKGKYSNEESEIVTI